MVIIINSTYLEDLRGLRQWQRFQSTVKEYRGTSLNSKTAVKGNPSSAYTFHTLHEPPLPITKAKTSLSAPGGPAATHQWESCRTSDLGRKPPKGVSKRMRQRQKTSDSIPYPKLRKRPQKLQIGSAIARSEDDRGVHEPNYGSKLEEIMLHVKPFQRDFWTHSVNSSLLNRRAWVLLERLTPQGYCILVGCRSSGNVRKQKLVKRDQSPFRK